MQSASLLLLALLGFLLANESRADGWKLENGRSASGSATVFNLTARQKQLAEIIARCHTNNQLTPYVFSLEPSQRLLLKQQTGISVTRLALFDTRQKQFAVELATNIALRFSGSQFEVPHQTLISEATLHNWERDTMGWSDNPIGHMSLSSHNSACPAVSAGG